MTASVHQLAQHRLRNAPVAAYPMPALDLLLAYQPLNDFGNGRRLLARFGHRVFYAAGAGWCVRGPLGWTRDQNDAIAGHLARVAAASILNEAEALIEIEGVLLESELEAALEDNQAPDELAAIVTKWKHRWAGLVTWSKTSEGRFRMTLRAAEPLCVAISRDAPAGKSDIETFGAGPRDARR